MRAVRLDPVRLKPRVADRRAAESCPTDTAASTGGALDCGSAVDLTAKRASSQDLYAAAEFLYALAAL